MMFEKLAAVLLATSIVAVATVAHSMGGGSGSGGGGGAGAAGAASGAGGAGMPPGGVPNATDNSYATQTHSQRPQVRHSN
jgi:hypothetical protein